MTTVREKLIKIGAKVVRTARYVVFQMAQVAVLRNLFRTILDRTRRLRPAKAVCGDDGPAESWARSQDQRVGIALQRRKRRRHGQEYADRS